MIYCAKCGAELNEEARFCSACGASVKKTTSEKVSVASENGCNRALAYGSGYHCRNSSRNKVDDHMRGMIAQEC